jgi:hypothetical protein
MYGPVPTVGEIMGDLIAPASSWLNNPAETALVGFGGWLVILAFGATVGPIVSIALPATSYELPRTRGNIIVFVRLLAVLIVQLFLVVALWRRCSYLAKLFAAQSGLLLPFGLLCLLGRRGGPGDLAKAVEVF